MSTRISDLDKLITLQYQTRVSDSMGGFTTTWVDAVSDIYAAIWSVSAKERMQSGQTTMIATHRIKTRYRRVLKPDWRIKYGTRYFNIVEIVNIKEANRMFELLCKEVRS